VAAGFDKFGLTPRAMNSLGVSHVEVGTITLMPQEGNPKPRVFRLTKDRGLINRMGFNSPGALVVERNLAGSVPKDLVIGISVGANKISVESGQSVTDFVATTKLLAHRGQYIAVNVSSPNTPGLRDLQHKEAFAALLDELLKAKVGFFPNKPVLVKIAPDLTDEQLDDVLEVITSRDIAGIIATNTTNKETSRLGLKSRDRSETGGLSGRPLFARSTEMVRYIYQHTEGRLVIWAAGGVFNADDALTKILAGATVVQVWTGLVYEGPLLPWNIHLGLSSFMDREGVRSIGEIVGAGN
jgi:dihydroorotate dehydrogenase